MPQLKIALRFLFNKKLWAFIGSSLAVLATIYTYGESTKPTITVEPSTLGTMKMGKEDLRFDIPFSFENSGNSIAKDIETYHAFFNWPPSLEDEASTNNIPDLAGGRKIENYVLQKYLKFKSFQASINFFHYQNLILITRWKSENFAHTGQTFYQAQWYRMTMGMPNQLGLSQTKSRYYRRFFSGDSEKVFKEILMDFVKDETLESVYNLDQLDWERRVNEK